jgi:hypothetical protein
MCRYAIRNREPKDTRLGDWCPRQSIIKTLTSSQKAVIPLPTFSCHSPSIPEETVLSKLFATLFYCIVLEMKET